MTLRERLRSRRWKLRLVAIATTAVVLWLVVSLGVAQALTKRRHPWFAEPVPAVAWGQFEPHRLTTRDGQEIGAWLLPGRDDAPAVLLLHGNGGSRHHCLKSAEILAARGCTVLMISLRAHGDSSGEFNDIGYSARLDVVAAVEFLERRRPGGPILIHGTSAGAAAATFASGELGRRIHGYVLECPYRDLRTAVWNRIENALPPVMDRIAYTGMVVVSPLVLPDLDAIAPIRAVNDVPDDVPVLILAGGADRQARPEEARALYEQVRNHAKLSIYDDAGHVKLHVVDPARYRDELLGFVAAVEARFRAQP
jgi:uncharacterized protein